MDSIQDTLEKYADDYELLGAVQHLREAEQSLGIESDEFVHALIQVGSLLNARSEFLDALGYFIRGRGVLEAREEQLHPLMCQLLRGIGEHYQLQGMLVEALPYFQKALAVSEALCIGDTFENAQLHMKAGEILCIQGELSDAKEHMLRAYQILSHLKVQDDGSLGDVAHNLGVILLSEKYFERAVDYFEEASQQREQYFGTQSLERADSLWALGRCYEGLQSYSPALEKYYESISIREEILGEGDPAVLDSKEYYREVSTRAHGLQTETVILEVPHHKDSSTDTDRALLSALMHAASLALHKGNWRVAGEIISIAQACIENDTVERAEVINKIVELIEKPISS